MLDVTYSPVELIHVSPPFGSFLSNVLWSSSARHVLGYRGTCILHIQEIWSQRTLRRILVVGRSLPLLLAVAGIGQGARGSAALKEQPIIKNRITQGLQLER